MNYSYSVTKLLKTSIRLVMALHYLAFLYVLIPCILTTKVVASPKTFLVLLLKYTLPKNYYLK